MQRGWPAGGQRGLHLRPLVHCTVNALVVVLMVGALPLLMLSNSVLDGGLARGLAEVLGADLGFAADPEDLARASADRLWRLVDLHDPESPPLSYRVTGIPELFASPAGFGTDPDEDSPEEGRAGASKPEEPVWWERRYFADRFGSLLTDWAHRQIPTAAAQLTDPGRNLTLVSLDQAAPTAGDKGEAPDTIPKRLDQRLSALITRRTQSVLRLGPAAGGRVLLFTAVHTRNPRQTERRAVHVVRLWRPAQELVWQAQPTAHEAVHLDTDWQALASLHAPGRLEAFEVDPSGRWVAVATVDLVRRISPAGDAGSRVATGTGLEERRELRIWRFNAPSAGALNAADDGFSNLVIPLEDPQPVRQLSFFGQGSGDVPLGGIRLLVSRDGDSRPFRTLRLWEAAGSSPPASLEWQAEAPAEATAMAGGCPHRECSWAHRVVPFLGLEAGEAASFAGGEREQQRVLAARATTTAYAAQDRNLGASATIRKTDRLHAPVAQRPRRATLLMGVDQHQDAWLPGNAHPVLQFYQQAAARLGGGHHRHHQYHGPASHQPHSPFPRDLPSFEDHLVESGPARLQWRLAVWEQTSSASPASPTLEGTCGPTNSLNSDGGAGYPNEGSEGGPASPRCADGLGNATVGWRRSPEFGRFRAFGWHWRSPSLEHALTLGGSGGSGETGGDAVRSVSAAVFKKQTQVEAEGTRLRRMFHRHYSAGRAEFPLRDPGDDLGLADDDWLLDPSETFSHDKYRPQNKSPRDPTAAAADASGESRTDPDPADPASAPLEVPPALGFDSHHTHMIAVGSPGRRQVLLANPPFLQVVSVPDQRAAAEQARLDELKTRSSRRAKKSSSTGATPSSPSAAASSSSASNPSPPTPPDLLPIEIINPPDRLRWTHVAVNDRGSLVALADNYNRVMLLERPAWAATETEMFFDRHQVRRRFWLEQQAAPGSLGGDPPEEADEDAAAEGMQPEALPGGHGRGGQSQEDKRGQLGLRSWNQAYGLGRSRREPRGGAGDSEALRVIGGTTVVVLNQLGLLGQLLGLGFGLPGFGAVVSFGGSTGRISSRLLGGGPLSSGASGLGYRGSNNRHVLPSGLSDGRVYRLDWPSGPFLESPLASRSSEARPRSHPEPEPVFEAVQTRYSRSAPVDDWRLGDARATPRVLEALSAEARIFQVAQRLRLPAHLRHLRVLDLQLWDVPVRAGRQERVASHLVALLEGGVVFSVDLSQRRSSLLAGSNNRLLLGKLETQTERQVAGFERLQEERLEAALGSDPGMGTVGALDATLEADSDGIEELLKRYGGKPSRDAGRWSSGGYDDGSADPEEEDDDDDMAGGGAGDYDDDDDFFDDDLLFSVLATAVGLVPLFMLGNPQVCPILRGAGARRPQAQPQPRLDDGVRVFPADEEENDDAAGAGDIAAAVQNRGRGGSGGDGVAAGEASHDSAGEVQQAVPVVQREHEEKMAEMALPLLDEDEVEDGRVEPLLPDEAYELVQALGSPPASPTSPTSSSLLGTSAVEDWFDLHAE